MTKMIEDYPGVVDTFCVQTQERSYWYNLSGYYARLIPGCIQRTFEKSCNNDDDADEEPPGALDTIVSVSGSGANDIADMLANSSRALANICYQMEEVVDGLLSVALFGDWKHMRGTTDAYNEEKATINLDFPPEYRPQSRAMKFPKGEGARKKGAPPRIVPPTRR
jgi:hypothetical protein